MLINKLNLTIVYYYYLFIYFSGIRCPICLDDDVGQVTMFNCGHFGCVPCQNTLLGNAYRAGEDPRCSICRGNPSYLLIYDVEKVNVILL